jgi:hypothetical protein
MPAASNIQYLNQKEINKELWDQCIDRSPNGLIYAHSIYLDYMTDHWDGLVLNNYEAVMPLPWRKKYGIYYLYQPFLIAQLGLFANTISPDLLRQFLSSIPRKFRYWDMMLNHQNFFPTKEFPLYQRTNYVLDLHHPYEDLFRNYRENIRRNIKKAKTYGCSAQKNVSIHDIIALAKDFTPGALNHDFANFTNLYLQLNQTGKAQTYGIFSAQNQLLASCVILYSHNRIYYILVGNHPNGRTLGASHALIDEVIKDHSIQPLLFDFEGSDIRNLAFFYSSFGAKEERYAGIKLNRLPWYLKWTKK